MRILVTASCDFQDADILTRCLLMKGHNVLFQNRVITSAVAEDFQPDVTVCYGSVAATVSDSPLVQVRSGSGGMLHRHVDLFVFSGESVIPGGFEGRAVAISRPVDTHMFHPVAQSGEKIILALGRLDPEKGHKTFVQAMTMVNPDFRAVIAGREARYTVGQMRNYAESLGVGSRVEFVGEVEDVSPFLSCAAVGVVASLANQPVFRAGMEFMASGVPLLVAAAAGLCDYVTDGVTGLFHSPGNWKQLAGQINHLIENCGPAGMLAGNAREYCEKHLSFESVGDRWTEVMEQLSFE
ncbi:MAG: glycosyltransferase family 4 protein [Candidatus Sabulitectum sp.]|nr:glycosyltransferase family 4 protein [Candidatus Sabulitectum sp.]